MKVSNLALDPVLKIRVPHSLYCVGSETGFDVIDGRVGMRRFPFWRQWYDTELGGTR